MYRYLTNCTCAKGDDIGDMVDKAREIVWQTFWRHVCREEVKMLFPHYDWEGGPDLKLKNDYAVRFYRSKFRKKRCYFVDHSCIEYVFTEK